MMPPKRQTYKGTIRDEGDAIVLAYGGGFSLVINMNGFNPAADRAALLPFVGKQVEIEGFVPPRSDSLVINGIDAIKLQPGPRRPRAPKP